MKALGRDTLKIRKFKKGNGCNLPFPFGEEKMKKLSKGKRMKPGIFIGKYFHLKTASISFPVIN